MYQVVGRLARSPDDLTPPLLSPLLYYFTVSWERGRRSRSRCTTCDKGRSSTSSGYIITGGTFWGATAQCVYATHPAYMRRERAAIKLMDFIGSLAATPAATFALVDG